MVESAHNLEKTSFDISTGIKDSSTGMEKIDISIDNINKHSQDNVISFNDITSVTQEALKESELIFKKGSSMKKESEQIMKSVDEGSAIILKSVQAIGEVENNSKEISHQIQSLKASSLKVQESISMITSVTSGIRLLSLNASIEAVNAGQNSKGFFVIAQEVRKLAEQTEEFSKDIGSMLIDFNTGIDSLLLTSNQNIEFVNTSVKQTLAVNSKLDIILNAIKSSQQNIDDISETSIKHASISRRISDITDKTSKATHDIAADVEDISRTIKEQLKVLSSIEKASTNLHSMSEELKSKIVENENVIETTQKSK
jgi:methyl-accepting chemotaxis protein